MKIITHRRYLFALSTATLLALGACSKHSAQTDSENARASAPSVAVSGPAASQPASVASATDEPDEANENGDAKPQPQQSASASNGPRIKGIALGESSDVVQAAVTALIPQGSPCHIDEKTDASNPFLNLTIHTPYGIALNCGTAPTQPNYVAIFEFKDRALTAFTFGAELSVSAFNVAQTSTKDFAQTFINAYNIPHLDPSENQQFMTYHDPNHGWAVDLFQDKSFKVYAVATASQQAKSFN
ncbi:hypothetical protein [Burkholderia gladioli]|uniref:hypothetical protein n=1 Tax=Burkholderia gladioli TaxID=28095 RepID=UPI0016410CDC|nr:hypothetical protein [Burkholderia gladioli]